jgi:hypothetical protein
VATHTQAAVPWQLPQIGFPPPGRRLPPHMQRRRARRRPGWRRCPWRGGSAWAAGQSSAGRQSKLLAGGTSQAGSKQTGEPLLRGSAARTATSEAARGCPPSPRGGLTLCCACPLVPALHAHPGGFPAPEPALAGGQPAQHAIWSATPPQQGGRCSALPTWYVNSRMWRSHARSAAGVVPPTDA